MAIPNKRPQDPNLKSEVAIPLGVFKATAQAQQAKAKQASSATSSTSTRTGDSPTEVVSGKPKVTDTWRDLGKVNINPLGNTLDKPIVRKSVNALSDVIGTIEAAIEILKITGKIINAFQSDANSLFVVINFAIQAIIDVLKELAVSISSTGVYVLPLLPETSPFDPSTPAGGGFKEVMAKVNHSLTNSQDPNRPVFFDGDYLGSVIFLLTAGTNAGDVIKDLSILVKFLQGDDSGSKLSTVTALNATPGLYYETEGQSASTYDTITDYLSAAAGVKLPGIKVSWGAPQGIPGIYGYRIYRSKTQEGTPELDDKGNLLRVPADSPFNAGRTITQYVDYAFNNGKPVLIKESKKNKLEYVDFEVYDGEIYFYKVVPVFKDSAGSIVEGEVISQYTSAKASACLPSDLLLNTYETPDGLLRGKASGDPPYWNNVTLRGLLGESMDSLLRSVQSLADRLKGVSTSSSKHFEELIETLQDWVDDLTVLLEKIKKFLESLKALQFSANAMVLTIPSESGGVAGLKSRINQAGFSSNLRQYLDATDNNCTIYGGLMFVVGAPTGSSFDKLGNVASDELDKIKKAGNFESAKAQFSAGRKGLADKVGNEDDTDFGYAEDIMGFLTGLFGGS